MPGGGQDSEVMQFVRAPETELHKKTRSAIKLSGLVINPGSLHYTHCYHTPIGRRRRREMIVVCAFKFMTFKLRVFKFYSKFFLTLFGALNFRIFYPMKSIARHHFPRIVFDHKQKKLFNPILKKRYKNRPEERVRLKWVEYLLQQTGWSKSRIGFEAPVRLRQEKNTLRADLVLYNKAMKPEILIECKAESVPLTPAVAEQAARYNVEVDADYLCLTNGVSDYWFDVSGKTPTAITSPIQEKRSFSEISKTVDWWTQRGFLPIEASSSVTNLVPAFLDKFWSDSLEWETRYLNITARPVEADLNHYYRIVNIDNDQKLAVSFIGTPGETGYLAALLNKMGQNSGFLAIRLTQFIDGDSPGAVLFKDGEKHELHTGEYLSTPEHLFNPNNIKKLPIFLMRCFD